MAAKNQNAEIWANDRESMLFVVKDSNGVVVDISTASAIVYGFSTVKDGPVLVTKSLGSGVAITDGPAGKFTVTLEPADTNGRSGRYYHFTKVTLGGNGKVTSDGELLVNVHCLD